MVLKFPVLISFSNYNSITLLSVIRKNSLTIVIMNSLSVLGIFFLKSGYLQGQSISAAYMPTGII